MLAVQADGAEITTIEGLMTDWQATSDAGRVLGTTRPAVRLLHARNDHGATQIVDATPTLRAKKYVTASKEICVAALAINISSKPLSTRESYGPKIGTVLERGLVRPLGMGSSF